MDVALTSVRYGPKNRLVIQQSCNPDECLACTTDHDSSSRCQLFFIIDHHFVLLLAQQPSRLTETYVVEAGYYLRLDSNEWMDGGMKIIARFEVGESRTIINLNKIS
tara:strand:+ start:4297 stop:4617 length:321 start_codon:yes stop_codon:yes gene_type:complete